MIPIEQLISSKAIREQCVKENRIFSPFEQAIIVWNNISLNIKQKIELLKQIKDSVEGQPEYKQLYDQLSERINFQKTIEERFFSKEDGEYFILRPYFEFQQEYRAIQISFSSLEKVNEYRKKMSKKENGRSLYVYDYEDNLIIEKHYLDKIECIECKLRKNNEVYDMSSANLDPVLYDANNFIFSYIKIPNPFKKGDFVTNLQGNLIAIYKSAGTNCKPDNRDYIDSMVELDELIITPDNSFLKIINEVSNPILNLDFYKPSEADAANFAKFKKIWKTYNDIEDKSNYDILMERRKQL